MKILIHFSFSPEQIQIFQQIADAHSQHKVVQAHSESEAIAMAEDAEVLLGLFPPAVCEAAPDLRWIQSHSASMDSYFLKSSTEMLW